MTVRTCAVCGRIGPNPLIWYEEENPAGGVLSRFVEQAPSEEAKDVVCEGCLPKVLEMGIGCCKQLSSIRKKPTGKVTIAIRDSEPEQVPRQEAGAGVMGKGDVGEAVRVDSFTLRVCAARSGETPVYHEPLEIAPHHVGEPKSGPLFHLFELGFENGLTVQARVCKHCGALYAEVVTAEKKPVGA